MLLLFSSDRLYGETLQACGMSRETLKFLNAALSKLYPANFCYVMDKLLIFNICKT